MKNNKKNGFTLIELIMVMIMLKNTFCGSDAEVSRNNSEI